MLKPWCFLHAAVYNMERLKTEFNALNKAIGVKRKVSQPLQSVGGLKPTDNTPAA